MGAPCRRALIFSGDRPRRAPLVERVTAALERHGVTPADRPPVDVVLSLGGDGTLLHAVHRLNTWGGAFLGIHAGRLGFWQEAHADDLERAVARLATGDYTVAPVPLLEARVTGAGGEVAGVAINDVVVERESSRTLFLSLAVNGRSLGDAVADGVLVATPWGSPGYALSARGAVVHPGVLGLQLLLVNAHPSSVSRPLPAPLVLPPDARIRIEVQAKAFRSARVVLDGETLAAPEPEAVEVAYGDRTVGMVRFEDRDFLERFREKILGERP